MPMPMPSTETTDAILFEHWLHSELAPVYDAMKADPSRSRSLDDVQATLAAESCRAETWSTADNTTA